MGKFRSFISRFMYGRYGVDRLYTGFFILFLIIQILSLFTKNVWFRMILSIISAIIVFVMFYRVFSKKIYKRRREEQIYLSIVKKIKRPFNVSKRRFKERKTHIYKKCPVCKAQLRFPRKKGTIMVTCPKCRENFKIHCK